MEVKTCQRCGKPLTGMRHHMRKYCVGGPCKQLVENDARRARYTPRPKRADDIPPAQIEKLFQAAKARQQWERRVGLQS